MNTSRTSYNAMNELGATTTTFCLRAPSSLYEITEKGSK